MDDRSSRTLVMKFGGTSVGSASAMGQMAAIVRHSRQDWPRVVVVVSALTKVTDLLLEQASLAAGGDVRGLPAAGDELRRRHAEIADKVVLAERRAGILAQIAALVDEFDALCRAIAVLGEASPRAMDAVASLGERMSARLAAEAVIAAGVPSQTVDATRLIVTDDNYQSATPDVPATNQNTREVLNPLLDAGIVPLVTGFIAASRRGVVTTLGREAAIIQQH